MPKGNPPLWKVHGGGHSGIAGSVGDSLELPQQREALDMTVSKTRADADRGYDDEDLAEVSDNPEWTAEEIRTAKPLDAFMPELAAAIRRTRGAQKTPTKQLISLRLDREVVDRFKAGGRGWQSRMGTALRKAAGLES